MKTRLITKFYIYIYTTIIKNTNLEVSCKIYDAQKNNLKEENQTEINFKKRFSNGKKIYINYV